jgi:SAM-dependent methyltransferase
MSDDLRKLHAPAAERNRGAILDVLRTVLGADARILEIGSGTGQHAAHFTENERGWSIAPTDLSPTNVESIAAYRAESRSTGFLEPRRLDVLSSDWPSGPFDAVYSANVVHITPWPVAVAIFAGAARLLAPTGVLILYGPFRFSGRFTADSNAAFDARLRGDNPEWGVRDVDDLDALATENGLHRTEVRDMPANNHVLVFRRNC